MKDSIKWEDEVLLYTSEYKINSVIDDSFFLNQESEKINNKTLEKKLDWHDWIGKEEVLEFDLEDSFIFLS